MGGNGMMSQGGQSVVYVDDDESTPPMTMSAVQRSVPVLPHTYVTLTSNSWLQVMVAISMEPLTEQLLCLQDTQTRHAQCGQASYNYVRAGRQGACCLLD